VTLGGLRAGIRLTFIRLEPNRIEIIHYIYWIRQTPAMQHNNKIQ